MPCKMSCTSSNSSPLVSAVSLLRPSRPLITWSPLFDLYSRLSVALVVLRLKPASLGSSTPYCVIASTDPQFLTGLQALTLLCPINHHLVGLAGFSAACMHHCRTLWPGTGNNTLASSSACSVIALASALASLPPGFSASLPELLLCLRSGHKAPQAFWGPRRKIILVFATALNTGSYLHKLRSRLRDSLFLLPQFLSCARPIVALCPSVRPCQI